MNKVWGLQSFSTAKHPTFVTGIIVTLLAACAEVQPPPGGPEDKTQPVLIASEPENRSVEVPIDNRITLFFSEKVVPPRNIRAVFISPRPREEPELNWKGDRLEIVLSDSFAVDQTYIISASSSIADRRGNKLDSAGIIAFTTGLALDTGRVEGQVLEGDNPRPGLLAALYDVDLIEDTTTYDSLSASYFSQTNSDGQFAFQYLPDKDYHLIVFDDRNGNELFNPARETFALADRKIAVGSGLPLDNLLLSLTRQDTLLPEMISVTYTADQLLRIRLSRETELEPFRRDRTNILLTSITDTTQKIPVQSILEIDQEASSLLTCSFGLLIPGLYQLRVVYDSSQPPLVYHEIEVRGLEDKTPPVIAQFYPDQPQVTLWNLDMQLVFSEPLDTTRISEETFVLWQEPDIPIGLDWQWEDAFRMNLSSPDIQEGQEYRLTVTEFDLVDYSRNTLGDSLRDYSFAVFDTKSFGAIAGHVAIYLPGKQDDPVQLVCRELGTRQEYRLTVMDSSFNIDVPGRQYFLYGFIDSDNDGSLNRGKLHPFRLAETQTIYPDTISVRQRFETAGIVIEFR